MERHSDEKRRIAMAAADLIQDGDTISLTPACTISRSLFAGVLGLKIFHAVARVYRSTAYGSRKKSARPSV
ncbi:MAG: hypothetical protein ACRD4P_06695 [Bryobacteraceae bacterium]